MADQKAYVFKADGETLGYFLNPDLTPLSDDQYLIKGFFYDLNGQLCDRIEFNPQILSYEIDVSLLAQAKCNRLFSGYVQRTRQPVEMTASAGS